MKLHDIRLSTRITVITLLIVAVGVEAFLFLELAHHREIYISQQNTDLEKNLQAEKIRLTHTIDTLRRDVLFLSSIPAIPGIMRASLNHGYDARDGSTSAQWGERLNKIFFAFAAAHPDCYVVRYIAVADGGKELVRVENRDGHVDITPPGKLVARGSLDDFKAFPELQEGQIGLSKFGLSLEIDGLPKRTLRAVAPVFTPAGKLFGMVIVSLDVNRLLESATLGLPSGTQTYITNKDGQYLLHPDSQRAFRLGPGSKGEITADFPFIKTIFDPHAADYLPLHEVAAKAGKYAAASRIQFDSGHPERFLLLMYLIPDAVVARHIAPIPVADIVAGLVAMLLVGGIALFVLRRTFSPLEQVAAAANKIAAGDRDISLPKIGGGEIGSLTSALDTMMGKLQQREKLLRKSEAMLRESQRMAQIGSWELDLASNVLSWSDENYCIFEIDRTRFGASYEAFLNTIHPDDRSMVNQAYTDSVKNRTPYDVVHRLLFPDQRVKYAREWCETIYDQEGCPVRSIGTTQDVTVHKLAEEALRASESRYRLLVESSPFCIHEIDLEGRLQSMNKAGLNMLGMNDARKICGIPYLDAVNQQDAGRIGALLRDAIANGTPSHFEFAAAGDVPLYFKSCFIPIKDANGKVLKLMGITEDITERKQFEEMRAKMADTGRFNIAEETAISLTHELSQPLTACNNYLDVCLRRIGGQDWGTEKFKETLQLAHKQIGRAGEIINHFKKQVKRQEFEYTLLDVNLLAKDVMVFLAGEIKRQGISMHMVLSPLPQVMASKEEIRQVLLSLCENAIEAMHSSSQREMCVTTRIIESGHVTVGVSDSGEGVLPAMMNTLFEPFQTSKKGKLGLSLSICRSIIEKHGGRIWADPQRKSGAVFYFTLPIKAHHE